MSVTTTLNFFGRTEEAVNFYCQALEAKLLFLMRFRESPDQSMLSPGSEDKIFHATIRIGNTELMASDVGCEDAHPDAHFEGFALAVRTTSIQQAENFYSALAAEGNVIMPLAKTAFAARYGVVVDRFGLTWKIISDSEEISEE